MVSLAGPDPPKVAGVTTRPPEISSRAKKTLRRVPRRGQIDLAAAARFCAVLGDLPLDIGTPPDQRAVRDALEALTEAVARRCGDPS